LTSAQQIKRRIAEYAQALHARGWVANHDGNVSSRLDGDPRFAITPTAISKRLCRAEALAICELSGKVLPGAKAPSEVALHVGAYRRSDVRAVIHAHPPQASAFALAGRALEPIAMPEVVVSLGPQIPLIATFLPKDPAVADAVASALATADAILLGGNGVLTVGEDLEQAYLRLELVEHYARIVAAALPLGGPRPLEEPAMTKLLEQRKQAGLGPKVPNPRLRPIVAEEVRRVLGGNK
jgi:L-fuculose-phosphate aldolase